MFVFLLQDFICNYMTAMQYTVEKYSLNGKEWDIIFQFMFIFDKVITY